MCCIYYQILNNKHTVLLVHVCYSLGAGGLGLYNYAREQVLSLCCVCCSE